MVNHNLNNAAGRRALIAKLMEIQDGGPDGPSMVDSLQRLCRAAVHNLDVTGAAISLMVESDSAAVVAGADGQSVGLEELQFTLAEGPSWDAFALHRPVLTADLLSAGASRWLGFSNGALAADIRAVFAYPLQIGAITLGVFTVYRTLSGSFGDRQSAMALTFAEVATEIVLDGDPKAKPGALLPGLQEALDHRVQIYQAQGAVMVDLGVGLAEALLRMRAHAFAHDKTLAEISAEIMSGDLVFERED